MRQENLTRRQRCRRDSSLSRTAKQTRQPPWCPATRSLTLVDPKSKLGSECRIRGAFGNRVAGQTCIAARPLEEERHWDLQDMRDVLQAARAYAVRSALIFLHLLEREPKAVGELLLARSEHLSGHSDTAAHVSIVGVGAFLTIACSRFTAACGAYCDRKAAIGSGTSGTRAQRLDKQTSASDGSLSGRAHALLSFLSLRSVSFLSLRSVSFASLRPVSFLSLRPGAAGSLPSFLSRTLAKSKKCWLVNQSVSRSFEFEALWHSRP